MICFPNAKINIGLNIVEKRADGYHNLETVFLPIGLKDALECIESKELQFENSGLTIDGNPLDNLCVKAWKLLHADYNIPPVHIHLHKVIPFGAGLGGGSADAAFMLKLLNDYFSLHLNDEKLIEYALQLGSDCPLFIYNKPCFGTGRGEILEPITVDLEGLTLVLINPGIHIPTKEAFVGIRPKATDISVKEFICNPIRRWSETIINDFEEGIFKAQPIISDIKQTLYKQGALYASMSGSGSSVYGLFSCDVDAKAWFPEYFVWKELL